MESLFRVILLVSLLHIGTAAADIKKCCPEGEVVQVDSIEDNNLSPRRHFSCVEELQIGTKLKRKRDSEKYEINNSSTVTEIIAYNVLIDENKHWPPCSDSSYISADMFSESKKISHSASCVDIWNKQYFIFTCEEKMLTANDFVDIYRLRKCCEKEFSYDIFTRQCVNGSSFGNNFQTFLKDKTVVFESGIPQCKSDDVLVEYHSLVHKLMIHENSLVITNTNTHGPDLLVQNTYCIENTMNSAVDMPEGVADEHFALKSESKWIAKVCRPKDICTQIPCVRKCCKEGLRMVHDNETFCENHESHLNVKFHSFDIKKSPEQPNAMEPSGECLQH